MKKISPPVIDDVFSTTETANNASLRRTSFPHLRNVLPDVLNGYQGYVSNGGNALAISPMVISDELKQGLHKNYNSPPQSLRHIEQIRNSSPKVCPMCGSLKTSSLDHLLPKETYPEFTIFSKNLVPACDCNTKRKTNTVDTHARARVLHPYFDSCLQQRQIGCVLRVLGYPKVKIDVLCLNALDPMIASLQFHLNNVVLPSGLERWLDSQWSTLADRPDNLIHTLPHRKINNVNELGAYLNDSLQRHDAGYGTPNNWESIFIHGLIHSPRILQWVLRLHNYHYP